MALTSATRHALEKPFYPRTPSVVMEQRYLPPPANAPFIEKTYDIDSALKAANYLVGVEDRMLPVAFFAEPRFGFRRVIDLLTRLREWKRQGYTQIVMVHKPDPQVGFNQPFGRYYIWEYRLKTLKQLEPINRRVPGNLNGVDYWFSR